MSELSKITLQKIVKDDKTKKNNLVWGKLANGTADKTNPVLDNEYTMVTETAIGKLMLKYASSITVDDYAKDMTDLLRMVTSNVRAQLFYIEKGKITLAYNRPDFIATLTARLTECDHIVGAGKPSGAPEEYGDATE